MKVLMITGDKNIFISGTSAEARFALQRGVVEKLEAVYWGKGAWNPELPEGPFDVVTAQDPFWRGLFAWRSARRLQAKLNVQVHTDLSAYSFMRRILAQIVLRQASSVRVVSEKIKIQVEQMGVRAPVRILPIYVDLGRFRNLRHQPQEKKTILWVGRFEAEKDPLSAISILEEVRALGVDATLLLLGEGSLEQKLRERSVGLPVEFPGWQDPVTYMAVADVVINTSKHESFGASIIEALAAGVPAVGPDVGLLREAGAVIAERSDMAHNIVEILQSNTQGELKLSLPDAREWTEAWGKTLI